MYTYKANPYYVPLDLVQLELKIELERLERIEIFCNGYFHGQGHIHSP